MHAWMHDGDYNNVPIHNNMRNDDVSRAPACPPDEWKKIHMDTYLMYYIWYYTR